VGAGKVQDGETGAAIALACDGKSGTRSPHDLASCPAILELLIGPAIYMLWRKHHLPDAGENANN
jgi:hypothetical protein